MVVGKKGHKNNKKLLDQGVVADGCYKFNSLYAASFLPEEFDLNLNQVSYLMRRKQLILMVFSALFWKEK